MGDLAHDGDRGSPSALELAAEQQGRVATVTVRGELDAYTAPGLEALCSKIVDKGVEAVVLDLSGTTFLDSSGLRVIIALHHRIEEARGELTLDRPGQHILRLLEITGLRDRFVIAPPRSPGLMR